MNVVKKAPIIIAGFILLIIGTAIIIYEIFNVIPTGREDMTIWGVGLIIGVFLSLMGMVSIWFGVK